MFASFSRLVSRARHAMEARAQAQELRERDLADLRRCEGALALWLAAGILQNASQPKSPAAASPLRSNPIDAMARAAMEKDVSAGLLARLIGALEHPEPLWSASLSDAMRCSEARWHRDLSPWAHEALDCVDQMSYFPPAIWRVGALPLKAACERCFSGLASHWAREEREEIARALPSLAAGGARLAALSAASISQRPPSAARRL